MEELMDADFVGLLAVLNRVPGIGPAVGFGHDSGSWWVKFGLDIGHPLAWKVVQEFGHILNYLSLNEPLPTAFYPVSPPPYMNGGPEGYLSWVIKNTIPGFLSEDVAEWLLGRLPKPIENASAWATYTPRRY